MVESFAIAIWVKMSSTQPSGNTTCEEAPYGYGIRPNTELAAEPGLVRGIRFDTDLVLGNRQGNFPRPFKGLMDEFRIYDRSLTAEEILVLGTKPSSTQETISTVAVQISPNPVLGGQLTISSEETVGAVRILNTQGQIVQKSHGNASLDLIGLPKGLYIVQIAIHGQWIQKRIVVQ